MFTKFIDWLKESFFGDSDKLKKAQVAQSAPSVPEKPVETLNEVLEEKQEEVVQEEPPVSESPKEEPKLSQRDLNKMKKNELIALAKDQFGLDASSKNTKKELVQMILSA